ncbi:MAG TPA: prepilin-type N-terminal cleavage/methylation domain-containing protein [Zoogloea sp.]|uniref:type II secretion system protein n=1 Tax=Zoogloea sp. TaxID=49181 RepID=UPI002CB76D36|nr:prepilin-type N-terminal cleavage/methylation domain-containing protein [Zoogloea sp.]HMW53255.1 prepilin-type N-terminal cleavage/methylation domain-containing protein [Rhodocyclaceae bacterium]HMY48451.1 prepilin-type N-terminal cleavage/methylation domain-containing protein [Rhodocyclaceae bacterium]HMZ75907.1 prepilin-type N-terminal cleavage/methylation domain-containing protein [Rhodocyclaceae bacterium]HNB63155.1 prepilin-type N-terminal cleavage/methylation domain-containing protein 
MSGRGFTLIEMLVTVAVVAVLAAMAVPVGLVTVQRAKEGELRTALRQIREGIDTYKRYVDEGRIARAADANGYPPHLEDLVRGAPDAKSPGAARIYVMRRIPRDPFNTDAAIAASETWGRRSYASPPDAPEEGRDVFDVYSRSPSIGLNGIPYRDW